MLLETAVSPVQQTPPPSRASQLVCVPDGMVYLNSAQRGPALRSAAAAAQAQVGPSPDGTAVSPDRLRQQVAQFINAAAPETISFTGGTTAAINQVANGLTWADGDEIIVSDAEHIANFAPWLALQQQGVVIRPAHVAADGLLTPASVKALLTNRTRLVAFHHVSHLYGTVQPVNNLCNWLRSRGILSLVDGAQAIGRITVDVQESGCDFYAFGAAKALLGLPGIGVLYVRNMDEVQLSPTTYGNHNATLPASAEELPRLTVRSGPGRLEAAPLPLPLLAGLHAALAQIDRSGGMKAIEVQMQAIGSVFAECLRRLGPTFSSSSGATLGILSWPISLKKAQNLVYWLAAEKNILLGAGRFGSAWVLSRRRVPALLRVSPHVFNCEAEAAYLEQVLREITISS